MAVETGIRGIARPALARRIADALDAGSVLAVAGPGYGKTMALEAGLELSGRRAVWIGCGALGGEGARLLLAIVDGLRRAVPGLADVLAERLAAGLEPVDVRSATPALLAELEDLLAEPLAIVFDDAEALEGDVEALLVVQQLLEVRAAPLSVAIATRRRLPLRLAKLRAAGRLAELGAGDLGFTAGEAAELLRLRHGRAVTDEEVEAALAASEGWPMGVALAGLARAGEPGAAAQDDAAASLPREALFAYLAEEVLDRLSAPLRSAVVDSSIVEALTPELADALGLPAGFLDEAEQSGVFLRRLPSGARSYHPLFRAFLRERLPEVHGDAELAALHVRAAQALSGTPRQSEAIDHWLAAGRHDEALADLAMYGADLVRTSPATVSMWLPALPQRLPGEPRRLPLSAPPLLGAGGAEGSPAAPRRGAAGVGAPGR